MLSWSRGENSGPIRTPFDLFRIEIEQAPLGTVTIEGSTHSQIRAWKLGQEDWGVEARPNFTSTALTLYLRGRKLIRDGKTTDAFAVWHSIESTETWHLWIYSWCAGDSAEFMSQHKNWRVSDLLYREALLKTNGDALANIFLLRQWVPTFEERGNWDMVALLLRKAISKSESLNREGLFTACVLSDLALVTNWRRDLRTADQLYRRVLVIDKKLAPDGLVTARTLIRLAMVSLGRGDDRSAEVFLQEAKPLLDKVSPVGPDSAKFDGQWANVFLRRGDLSNAKDSLMRARDVLEARWPESLDLARALSSLAIMAARQGELDTAELQLQRALDIFDKEPVDPVLAFNLSNDLGLIAYERHDIESAEKYALRTEAILAKLAPASMDHAGCLINLGWYSFYSDHIDKSERYWLQAVALIRQVAPGTSEEAMILTGLSAVANKRQDFQKATQYASTAAQILEKVAPDGVDMADALQQLAQTSWHRGNLSEAEGYIQRALAIDERLVPQSSAYAENIADLAGILEAKGRTELATEKYEEAIRILESEMGRLGGNETTRSAFRASHSVIYKEYIDLLVLQGKVDQAFEVFEGSLARNLLELLAEAKIDVHEHVESSLRTQEQSLRREFATESDHRLRLLMGPHSDEQLKSSDAKIAALLGQFSGVESRIRDAYPNYAELTQAETTNVRDIQDHLLDSDTLLLEYSLGEKQSYLWLLSSDSISVHLLPSRVQIESETRRAYKELATPHVTGSSRPPNSMPALEALSRMILGPVEDQLGNKRLLIAADGALNYIPFSALRILDNSVGRTSALIAQHEIINTPSASVLVAMRRERSGRQPRPQFVAVLADPVFDSRDPRLTHRDNLAQSALRPALQTSEESSTALRSIQVIQTRWTTALGLDTKSRVHFSRLPYSRREAQAIIAATPTGQSLAAMDFKASRSMAMSPDLAQYKILHFATHGLVDTTHPEFSGLLFSLFDENGAPQIGLLSLEDIYNLNLPVDMVVLSACETGLGKEVRGEGLIGLTRGFMFAGASRVIASLWKVNDVATASLMGRFYRAMENDHLTPAAALREAQLAMQHDRQWAAPYYWAGFELQGEWK